MTGKEGQGSQYGRGDDKVVGNGVREVTGCSSRAPSAIKGASVLPPNSRQDFEQKVARPDFILSPFGNYLWTDCKVQGQKQREHCSLRDAGVRAA